MDHSRSRQQSCGGGVPQTHRYVEGYLHSVASLGMRNLPLPERRSNPDLITDVLFWIRSKVLSRSNQAQAFLSVGPPESSDEDQGGPGTLQAVRYDSDQSRSHHAPHLFLDARCVLTQSPWCCCRDWHCFVLSGLRSPQSCNFLTSGKRAERTRIMYRGSSEVSR